ncbi:hypothetical protein [Sporosarcina sp. ZBG7A]|uniref:hypothetical protein n=1 Tax=Sporosarcina sp. ZBG7A TaxID=1582223 RepID=UPI00057A8CD3|nr:hypothetical protein [Sporosarcina sp. ZBG7A]
MKRWLPCITLLFVLIGILSACNDQSIVKLKGESDYWEGTFVMTHPFKKKSTEALSYTDYELRVTFKGKSKELEGVNTLEYVYETDLIGASTEQRFPDLPENKTFSLKGQETGETAIEKDDKILITIRWDGQEESFTVD